MGTVMVICTCSYFKVDEGTKIILNCSILSVTNYHLFVGIEAKNPERQPFKVMSKIFRLEECFHFHIHCKYMFHPSTDPWFGLHLCVFWMPEPLMHMNPAVTTQLPNTSPSCPCDHLNLSWFPLNYGTPHVHTFFFHPFPANVIDLSDLTNPFSLHPILSHHQYFINT